MISPRCCDAGRPRAWRNVDAWHEHEAAPCGQRGGLRWQFWTRGSLNGGPEPDLSDCLVVRPQRWLLTVWEPLLTKAPGPHLARPYCCYLQTVIFYDAHYVVWPYPKVWNCNGHLRLNSNPTFLEWDQIEMRLGWNDQVEFDGDVFACAGARVLWAREPDGRRRWWVRHGLRRVEVPKEVPFQ